MKRFRVIDADGHCIEHDDQIAQYATYLGRSLKNADRSCFSYFPSLDGWFRAASDRIAAGDPESWVSFLHEAGRAASGHRAPAIPRRARRGDRAAARRA